MTGKPKIGKKSLLRELNVLFGQVEKLQKRTARSAAPSVVWDSVLGIQNAVQESIDRTSVWHWEEGD